MKIQIIDQKDTITLNDSLSEGGWVDVTVKQNNIDGDDYEATIIVRAEQLYRIAKPFYEKEKYYNQRDKNLK